MPGAHDRDWRQDFQSLNELELRDIPSIGAVLAETIGGVILLGRAELETARAAGDSLQPAVTDELIHDTLGAGLGLVADGDLDLIERWREAMCLQMGADEYERFILARAAARPSPHGEGSDK